MGTNHMGRQSIRFPQPPVVRGFASVAGKKEREANVFAADFLIRDADVLELMQSCDSNFFNVSKALRIPAPFFAFKLYSMVERGHAMRMPVDLDSTFLARKRC